MFVSSDLGGRTAECHVSSGQSETLIVTTMLLISSSGMCCLVQWTLSQMTSLPVLAIHYAYEIGGS